MFKILLKDSSYYLFGNIFAQVVGLLSVVAAMRTLPVAEFGVYSYALAFVTFFAFVADGGLSQYLIKEIAQNPQRAAAIYRKIQGLQLVLSFVIMTILAVAAGVLHSSAEFAIIMVLGLGAIVNGYVSPVFSSLIANGHRGLILRKDLAVSLVRLAYLGAFLAYGPSLLFFACTNLVCAIAAFGYCLYIRKAPEFSYVFRLEIDGAGFRKILAEGLPYSALMVANILYNRIDVVMLKYMAGETEVAVFSGATQFIYPFMFVSTVLATSIFPHLSRSVGNDAAFLKTRNNAAIIMAAVGFTLSAGLFLTSELFFSILFGGKYDSSIPVYHVLVWYLFIVFSYGAFSNALVAGGAVKLILKMTVLMLALNVGLNLFLIPHFGAVGAAVATLVCEIIILISVVTLSVFGAGKRTVAA